MKLTSFFSVILLILLLSSCQKEISNYASTTTGDSTVSNSGSLVKRYVEDIYLSSSPTQHSIDSFLLAYDSKGRLLTLSSVTTPGDKFVYTYADNSFSMDLYNSNTVSIHENFFLKNGLVDSTFQYNDEGDTMTEKYTYNSAKQATKIIEYDYTTAGGAVTSNTTNNVYDTNGDLSTSSDDNGVLSYTYTTQTAYMVNIGLNYYSLSKHLPDAVTYVSSGGTTRGTHTYTFDGMKRLTVDKGQLDDGSVVEKRYYY